MLEEIPRDMQTDSVPGKCYHLHIETKGIYKEKEVALVLTNELYKRFKADVVWMRIDHGVIDIQLYGSPFAWAALIAFLPAILGLLGVTFIISSVWSVISAIPGYAWALLGVGIVTLYFAPKIGGMFTGTQRRYEVIEPRALDRRYY